MSNGGSNLFAWRAKQSSLIDEDIVHFHSLQQLPCHGLRPLKGFLGLDCAKPRILNGVCDRSWAAAGDDRLPIKQVM